MPPPKRDRGAPPARGPLINDKIRAREVVLIDQNGASLGTLSLEAALDLAASRALDLVEVNPTAVPPVCKLLDYGRFQFESSKKQRDAKKSQKTFTVKEVRFRPSVGGHDIDTKLKHIRRFLEEGDKVKLVVRLRGRELAHPELADVLLDSLAAQLKPNTVERPNATDARSRTMIVSPAEKRG